MRINGWLGVIFSTSLVACGGGGGDADAPPNPTPDSPPGTPDAPPGPPDADPNAPDAVPGAFDCNGMPNPTAADPSINVEGTTVELGTGGMTPVSGTAVDIFMAGGSTPLGSTTSSGATASFSFADLATGGVALDGYVRGTFTAGRKTVYVFPPRPIFETVDNVLVATVSQSTIDIINLTLPHADDQVANKGAIGVLVTDCLGNALEGATVSATNAGRVLYNGTNGLPNPSATSTGPDGIGIILNVTPNNSVTVDAQYQGYNMREHTIFVRTLGAPDNSISTTIVIP